VATDVLDDAAAAAFGVPARGALAGDPQVTERKVVSNGIGWIEGPQGGGDLAGSAERGVGALGEAEVPRDALDVGVDWDEKLRRGDRKEPQIHSVGGADHPAQIEQEPLAGAALARVGDQVGKAS